MTHTEALALIRAAYKAVLGRAPSEREAAVLAAVSLHETGYGSGWKPPGDGSFNMGAITAGSGWTGETFSYADSRPEAGRDVSYVTSFRKYPSADEGFKDLVRAVFIWNGRENVRQAALKGDLYAVARELYRTGYYKGRAIHSEAERIRAYQTALEHGIGAIGVTALFGQPSAMPWLILGLTGVIFWATVKSPHLPHIRRSPKVSLLSRAAT